MKRELLICVNRRLSETQPSCAARGGERLADALEALVRERGVDLEVVRIRCFGRCESGPNARIAGSAFVDHADPDDPEGVLGALLDDR